MAKTKTQKKEILQKYIDKLLSSYLVVILEAKNLKVNEVNNLRKELAANNSSLVMVKNKIAKIALKNVEIEPSNITLSGSQFMFLFTTAENFQSSLKVIKNFITDLKNKKNDTTNIDEKLKIYSGILEKKVISNEIITELTDMPEKEVTISQIVYMLSNPLESLINIIQSPLQCITAVLDKISKQN